jgi:hypothetical protein
MEFRMNDIPISDPKVASVMVRCLQKCDRAFNEALIETKELMPESDWNKLRLGVGHVLASSMFDMWTVIVKTHPQFNREAFGE